MKKLKKIFIGCLLLVFLIGGNVFTSRAREVTETLMELSEPADMVAWIFYEEQEPEVVVTGPDGTEYSEKLGNVQVKRGESSVYLYIPDASPDDGRSATIIKTAAMSVSCAAPIRSLSPSRLLP